MTPSRPVDAETPHTTTRRQWLARAADVVYLAAPLAGLGYWATILARSTHVREAPVRRMLLGPRTAMAARAVTEVRTADGGTIRVHAPQHAGEPWLALRDDCPHLGCRLTFDAGRAEYVCPCHRGRFDARGAPIAGPPRAAGLAMRHADLELDGDFVFLVARDLRSGEAPAPSDGPGSDHSDPRGRGRP